MTRTLISVFLATIAATLVLAHDLNLGGPVPNDHSVKNATVIRKPKFYSQRAVTVLGDGSNITSIRAVDHNITNNASVSVLLGGIGHHKVVLYFKAPRQRGLNFTVEVRGVHPPKPTRPPPPPTRPPPPPPTTEPIPPAPTTEPIPPPETSEPEPPQETTIPAEEEEEEQGEEEPRLLNRVYFANKFL